MKQSDIENAVKANQMLKLIDANIKNIREFIAKESWSDSGGIEGIFEYGYHCNLSEYSDGSGDNIDLSGCYVGEQVYMATAQILLNQREHVAAYLTSIGVSAVSPYNESNKQKTHTY